MKDQNLFEIYDSPLYEHDFVERRKGVDDRNVTAMNDSRTAIAHGVGSLEHNVFQVHSNPLFDYFGGMIVPDDQKISAMEDRGEEFDHISDPQEWIQEYFGVHNGFSCLHCDEVPIIGLRYQSSVSFNHNICQECYDRETKSADWVLVPLRSPNLPQTISCQSRGLEYPHTKSSQYQPASGSTSCLISQISASHSNPITEDKERAPTEGSLLDTTDRWSLYAEILIRVAVTAVLTRAFLYR